jgi:hypothetical protein
MHQSFISYRRGRWAWVAIALSVLSIAIYAWWRGHDLSQPPNGGTVVGYTLGTIGAALIVWLLYFGRRKRNYASTFGTVQGWLSAHVYLGTALLLVATLHSGMQFGWNVHTLAYVLMCIVIASGFFGVWAYVVYPDTITRNNQGKTLEELSAEVAELDRQIRRAAAKVGGQVEQVVGSGLDRTAFGGGAWAQLTARDSSVVVMDGRTLPNPDQVEVIRVLTTRLAQTSLREENSSLRGIADLVAMRNQVLLRMRRDIQVHALLRIWLYVHVPLSFATLAALLAHVVAVFAYW